jgi:hypothetical protein
LEKRNDAVQRILAGSASRQDKNPLRVRLLRAVRLNGQMLIADLKMWSLSRMLYEFTSGSMQTCSRISIRMDSRAPAHFPG